MSSKRSAPPLSLLAALASFHHTPFCTYRLVYLMLHAHISLIPYVAAWKRSMAGFYVALTQAERLPPHTLRTSLRSAERCTTERVRATHASRKSSNSDDTDASDNHTETMVRELLYHTQAAKAFQPMLCVCCKLRPRIASRSRVYRPPCEAFLVIGSAIRS